MIAWISTAPSWLQAGGLAVACCAGWPSAAQTISAADPAGVADALRDLGYRASVETDGQGNPMIRSALEGVDYEIYFYGCTGNEDCRYLNFTVGFDLPDGIAMSRVNEWNRDKLAGAAFVDDDNDPYLQYFVTTEGGLSRQNFADVVDWWRVAVAEFTDHIGW